MLIRSKGALELSQQASQRSGDTKLKLSMVPVRDLPLAAGPHRDRLLASPGEPCRVCYAHNVQKQGVAKRTADLYLQRHCFRDIRLHRFTCQQLCLHGLAAVHLQLEMSHVNRHASADQPHTPEYSACSSCYRHAVLTSHVPVVTLVTRCIAGMLVQTSRTPVVILVTTSEAQDWQSETGAKGARNFHRVSSLLRPHGRWRHVSCVQLCGLGSAKFIGGPRWAQDRQSETGAKGARNFHRVSSLPRPPEPPAVGIFCIP